MLTKLKPPLLRSGDMLDGEEFMERYEAMPDVHKAELIDGEVHMPSPVSFGHGNPHAYMSMIMATYQVETAGVAVASDFTVRINPKNIFQPDVSLFILPEHGGQSDFTERGYLDGAPELAVEVSVSTTPKDLTKKKDAYLASGLKEYLVWRVEDERVDWFVNVRGAWKRIAKEKDGTLRSVAFPGLWLDPVALVHRNMKRVMAVLQLGLSSDEHAEFVAKLAE